MFADFGLRLNGARRDKRRSPWRFLSGIETVLRNRLAPGNQCLLGTDELERPCLYISLHDAVPPITISLMEEARLGLRASTALAGPGFHRYVAKLVSIIEKEAHIIWELPQQSENTGDDTGFLSHGDINKLESHYLSWLQKGCLRKLESLSASQHFPTVWFKDPAEMPANGAEPETETLYQSNGALIGLSGPRDLDWIRNVSEDPSAGIDFFPWWTDFYSDLHFGSAMHKILFRIPWRVPVDQSEMQVLMSASAMLEDSYAVSPEREYPFAEWDEINELLMAQGVRMPSRELVIQRTREKPRNASLGYRRNNVRISRSGWSFELPGDFVNRYFDSESVLEARSLRGPLRLIRFANPQLFAASGGNQSLQATGLIDTFSRSSVATQSEPYWSNDGVLRKTIIDRANVEQRDCYWLKVFAAVDGGIAFLSIFVEGEEQLRWAHSVAESLKPNEKLSIISINTDFVSDEPGHIAEPKTVHPPLAIPMPTFSAVV